MAMKPVMTLRGMQVLVLTQAMPKRLQRLHHRRRLHLGRDNLFCDGVAFAASFHKWRGSEMLEIILKIEVIVMIVMLIASEVVG